MKSRLKVVHSINNFLFNKFRFPGSRKLGRIIANKTLPKLEKLTLTPTIYDFDLMLNKNGGLELYYLGFYEVGTLDIIKNCIEDYDNFIDIGASIGLMSVYSSKLTPNGKVLSFEPQKERFKILTQNKELNKCENIICFNNGLGEKEEELKLYTDVFSPSIVDNINSKSTFESINILVLDKVLESNNIDKVKFIKIDVEGFEIYVLKGANKLLSSEDAPIICIEYVKRLQKLNNNTETIFNYIKNINNYRIFQLSKSSNTISKLIEIHNEVDLRDCDNIYCFTENHYSNLKSKNIFK